MGDTTIGVLYFMVVVVSGAADKDQDFSVLGAVQTC